MVRLPLFVRSTPPLAESPANVAASVLCRKILPVPADGPLVVAVSDGVVLTMRDPDAPMSSAVALKVPLPVSERLTAVVPDSVPPEVPF